MKVILVTAIFGVVAIFSSWDSLENELKKGESGLFSNNGVNFDEFIHDIEYIKNHQNECEMVICNDFVAQEIGVI